MTAPSAGHTSVPGARSAVPMAVPERFTGARRPRPGEPVWLVHGVGVEDQLVGNDLRVRGVEELLWEILHEAGFERIVFSSFRESVYFRDEASRARTRRNGGRAAPRRPTMMTKFSGPLGRRMLVTDSVLGGDRPADGGPRPMPRAATDPQRLQMLDALMTQTTVPTAVVVPSVDTLLENMQPDMRRPFAEMIGRWSSGQVGDDNTCVLLFTQAEFEGVVDFVRDQRYLPQLANRLSALAGRRAAPAVSRIAYPDEAELARLIHLVRLSDGLRIEEWTRLPYLTRLMAAQDVSARIWLRTLRRLAPRRALSEAALRDEDMIAVPVLDSGDLWRRLDRMVGLRPVKEFLVRHRKTLEAGAALRERGRGTDAEPASMHLMFVGNPGTGKTMVAGMVGEFYRSLGLLRRGHVVNAAVEDLVSPNVGETARLTAATVRRALDGVLFIDEAYRLSDQRDGHGGQAIDVLLTEMENNRDRLVVIAAGYPGRMDDFLNSNVGLPRRFPVANRLTFPDYTPDELHAIVLRQLADLGLTCAPDLSSALLTVVTALYRTRNEQFGNAGTMRELAANVRTQWAQRTSPVPGGELPEATAADIPEEYRPYLATAAPLQDVLAELDTMVGLSAVKESIRGIAEVLRLRQLQPKRDSVPVAPHMLFLGSPGTGKTTVARLMGRVFASLGLLFKGHVVVTTRTDLVGRYIGHTGPKTRAKVLEALDGVLLIDEAYQLAGDSDHGNDFGREAVMELMTLMEEFRGRLVVIAAGYPDRMRSFLRSNEGLPSRFGEQLVFEDYSVPELRLIFERMAAAEGYTLAQGVQARVVRWLEAERNRLLDERLPFANARAVREFFGVIERRLARRVVALPPDQQAAQSLVITPADVPDPGVAS